MRPCFLGGLAALALCALPVVFMGSHELYEWTHLEVVQNDPMGVQMGTGTKAAIPGYQVSGKTGTAQQVNPACGCYSNDAYNITFAGIAPADKPRFVIGIMLDNPKRSSDGSGGQSAAPLFADIASWLLQRDRVPLSAHPAPRLVLQAD